MREFLKDEDGQAVVEFAIIAPILLLILCGIIDFGWIFSAQLATNNCAREGARYAATCSTYSTAQYETALKVQNVASENIQSNLNTNVSYSNMANPSLGDVTVIVTSEVKTLTIVADTIFGGGFFNLTSSVTMKVG
ncbi:MAG: hypothetical protein A2Y15_09870 [Clostridiales bacterium GWF2_36_10]|nr:MAG: hypothetical protein A2Y15_09870 [Clostridiales bacterium GWF2_36_10]